MKSIPLDAVPNQQMSVTLDNNRWVITVQEARGVMCATLELNGTVIIAGQRIVAGSPLIPYPYLWRNGNFWLLTENDELPYWDRFGIDQSLIYVSYGELP